MNWWALASVVLLVGVSYCAGMYRGATRSARICGCITIRMGQRMGLTAHEIKAQHSAARDDVMRALK